MAKQECLPGCAKHKPEMYIFEMDMYFLDKVNFVEPKAFHVA